LEEAVKQIALSIALAAEAAAALIIAFGALQAIFGLVKYGLTPKRVIGTRKAIWVGLGVPTSRGVSSLGSGRTSGNSARLQSSGSPLHKIVE
jgi:hypothetical protein